MSDAIETKAAAYSRVAREPEPTATALYCRTAQQSSVGIESQKERLSRFAADNGHANASWYIDDGRSGATLNRPALQQLIADIEAGIVKTVIAISCDRIARSIAPMLEWERLLRENDAKCVTMECGNPDSDSDLATMSDFMRLLSNK